MKRYGFDEFCVNMNYKKAFFAAKDVAVCSDKAGIPLYIYGGPQTGKTHLLYAIAQYIEEKLPDKRVIHLACEDYIEQLIISFRNRTEADFRAQLREKDVLLLDDIQISIGEPTTQEELVWLFNCIYEKGKNIVITGNRSQMELRAEGMIESLASRLEWGYEVEIPSDVIIANPVQTSKTSEFLDIKL